jgi:Na+-translocating ferredoxin:NAD+ oxidoreductase RnfG subunit
MVKRALGVGVLVLVSSLSAIAASTTGSFFSTTAVLKEFFKASEKVNFIQFDKQPGQKKADVVYVAESHGVVDGFAVVVEEIGQHEPITFGIAADASGRVVRVEVMAYREAYGSEIRSPRFLNQFVGAPAKSLDDVDAISGATLSVKSSKRAVARAVELIATARAQRAAATTRP